MEMKFIMYIYNFLEIHALPVIVIAVLRSDTAKGIVKYKKKYIGRYQSYYNPDKVCPV